MSLATNDNYDFSKACCLEIDSLIFKLKEILHIYIYMYKKTNNNIGKEHLSNIRGNYIEKKGLYVHSFIW